jgi:type 1 glutamine amidotransferase
MIKASGWIQFLPFAFLLVTGKSVSGQNLNSKPAFHALVLAERGGIHEGFVVAALDWLNHFSQEQHFDFTVINQADSLTTDYLSHYRVFIQLNFPPYRWSAESKAAFVKYMEEGQGGWVGFHHASLLGEFDGYPMWDWFSQFMGGIRWKNYIAARATATVHVEDKDHPVMKGLPETFSIPDDEWYTYDKDPRPNVHVLANVDESSYQPPSDIKMGDHPVIWTNEKIKARNVYFQMGHHANLFHSSEFKKMFANAILWAAGTNKKKPPVSGRFLSLKTKETD